MAFVCRLLRAVVGGLIVALVVSVAMGVFYRYALGNSLYWATEVPNFMLIWIVFLGAVVAFHEKQHIAFSLIQEMLPVKGGAFLEFVSSLIVLIFLGVLAYFGTRLALGTLDSPSEALKLPMGYIYACLPVSAALMAISAIENIIGALGRMAGRTSP